MYWASICTKKKITLSSWLRALTRTKSAISFWRRDKTSSEQSSGLRKISSEKITLHFRTLTNRQEDKIETFESLISSLRAIASTHRKSNLSTISFRLSSLPSRRTIITVKLFRWSFQIDDIGLQNLHGKDKIEIAARTFSRCEEEETARKEHFNGIYTCHRKRRREKKYSWMSLKWLRFFGTSVNLEEKENSCGLHAEKFFARTKHSSSRLHSIRNRNDALPDNHANDVGRVQELRKAKIFGTCRNLDLVEESTSGTTRKKSEKGKIEAGHRTSLLKDEYFFSTHLYPKGSSSLHIFQDSRYDNVFRFILGYGKIIWKAFNAVCKDFSLSWSFCPAKIAGPKNGRKR